MLVLHLLRLIRSSSKRTGAVRKGGPFALGHGAPGDFPGPRPAPHARAAPLRDFFAAPPKKPLTAAGRVYRDSFSLDGTGRLAQLGERRPYKPNVIGSIPVPPTKKTMRGRS